MGRRLICLNCYFHVCMHDLGGRGVRNLELAVCRNEFQYKKTPYLGQPGSAVSPACAV
jgi:hypothetical protein